MSYSSLFEPSKHRCLICGKIIKGNLEFKKHVTRCQVYRYKQEQKEAEKPETIPDLEDQLAASL